MNACCLCLALLLAADQPAKGKAVDLLFAINLQEAARWQMFLDEEHRTKAELNPKPIYIWTNPTRSGGQHGAVFVWLARGRPQVVGSVFSHPEQGRRVVCHE